MSFFDSIGEFFSAATVEIQAAIDETVQGWDEFVEDVLNEFDPSFLTEEEARQPPKPNSETAQLAAYAIAASRWKENLKDVWGQKPENLPMHIDLPRLITKIRATDADGTILWPTSADVTEDFKQIYSLFRFLSEKLGDANFPKGPEVVDKSEEMVPCLENFFKQDGADNSVTVRLLKAVHQKMLFPAYYQIKHLLQTTQIFGNDHVTVKHGKTQVIPSWVFDERAAEFQEAVSFQWELALRFDPCISEIQDLSCEVKSGRLVDALVPKEKAEFLRSKFPALHVEDDVVLETDAELPEKQTEAS